MNKKTTGLVLLTTLFLVGGYFLFIPKPTNGISQPEPISNSGYWYQGEIIHIEAFPEYDIIYILGRVALHTEVHVTIIRQMPSTFMIWIDEEDYLKLGNTRFKIEKTNMMEGWIYYETS